MKTSPLLFLDTNSLHFIKLYLAFTKKNKLWPFKETKKEPTEQFLKELHGASKKEPGFIEGLKKGNNIFQYIFYKSKLGAELRFSQFSVLELACGLLKGQAILAASENGMPPRMYNKITEDDIFELITSKAYPDIESYLKELLETIDNLGITIRPTGSERIKELWSLSQDVLGLVYLDSTDCLIYVNAVLEEADELITNDNYLRRMANKIQNPQDNPRDKLVNKSLKNILKGYFKSQKDINLPLAPEIKEKVLSRLYSKYAKSKSTN